MNYTQTKKRPPYGAFIGGIFTKDLMNYTQTKKRPPYGAFIGGILAIIILINPFMAKPALAVENNYISDTIWYYDNALDSYVFKFYVKTTFQLGQGIMWYVGWTPAKIYNAITGTPCYANPDDYIEPNVEDLTFEAGHTYKIIWNYLYLHYGMYCLPADSYWLPDTTWGMGHLPTTDDFLFSGNVWGNAGIGTYSNMGYYELLPGVEITYPPTGAEIADAFSIQGTYTLPAGSTLDKLVATVSGQVEIGEGIYANAYYSFSQPVSSPGGDIDLRIAGVPAGIYRIEFQFQNSWDYDDYWPVDDYRDITIVKSIPPELPGTHERPPSFFSIQNASQFYESYGGYATSTALYNALSGALEPLILSVGDSLTFFASRFNIDNAKDTGERLGNGILTVRTYANNLNSFFGNFPVAEMLISFLIILVVVVIFRLTRSLIGLIKP